MTALARICLVDLRATGELELAGYLAWLGPGEAARYSRFARQQRRRQFLVGRILLRKMLGQLLAIAPKQIELIERPGQAPLLDHVKSCIKTSPSPGFSLSHSGHWIACAVSAGTRLGLDIEIISLERDIDALAKEVFNPMELALLRQLPMAQRVPAFYRMWSAQEARYKLGSCDGPCEQPHCISLPHAQLSVALCSAQPLLIIPALEPVTLCAAG